KRTQFTELEIAEGAVELATKAAADYHAADPRAHVGYYLIDAGLPAFEAKFAYRPTLAEKLRRWCLERPTLTYLGTLTLLTSLIIAVLLVMIYREGANWLLMVAALIFALIPASDLALSILNWDVTHLFHPRLLPRINTNKGIPENACTMVVVPTLFSSEAAVHDLLEKLEV